MRAVRRPEDVLGVGGRVVPRFESGRPAWLPPEFDWVVGCTYDGHRSSRGPVRNLIGANMSFRRSRVRRDRRLPLRPRPYGDEAGRLRGDRALHPRDARARRGVFYEPDAVVHHFVPDARTTRAVLPRAAASPRADRRRRSRRSPGRERGLASERAVRDRALPRAVRARARRRARPRPAPRRSRVSATHRRRRSRSTAAGYVRGRVATRVRLRRRRPSSPSSSPRSTSTEPAGAPARTRPAVGPPVPATCSRSCAGAGEPRGVVDARAPRRRALAATRVAELVGRRVAPPEPPPPRAP